MDELDDLLRLADDDASNAPPDLADRLWPGVAATFEQARNSDRPVVPLRPATEPRPSRRRSGLLVAAAVLMLLGLGGLAVWQSGGSDTEDLSTHTETATTTTAVDTTCTDTAAALELEEIPFDRLDALADDLDTLAAIASETLAPELERAAATLRQASGEAGNGQTLQAAQTRTFGLRPLRELTASTAGDLWVCLGG